MPYFGTLALKLALVYVHFSRAFKLPGTGENLENDGAKVARTFAEGRRKKK